MRSGSAALVTVVLGALGGFAAPQLGQAQALPFHPNKMGSDPIFWR